MQLDLLLKKAEENHLLIKKEQPIKSIHFKFKKNKTIFEILSIDLSCTKIEKTLSSNYFYYSTFLLLILTLITSCYIFLSQSIDLLENYKKVIYQVPFQFTNLLIFIFIGSFFGKVIHELGHYYFYKVFGGKCTIFGFGFLFFIIPIFYNKLYISLLNNKWKKILIYSGGIIFDILLFLAILLFVTEFNTRLATLSFIGYTIMISIVIRSCFNLNFFLPGSDSYFILSEVLNKTDLFDRSYSTFKEFIRFPRFNISHISKTLYFVLSIFSIIAAWLFFGISFFMLFYYGIF